MTLQERLRDDLKRALKQGDLIRSSTIRMLIAGIRNAEIDKGATLDDAGVLGIIEKEIKRHRDSIEAFGKANRQDLVSKEEAELAVLQSYMPPRVSREEIIEAARRLIQEVGARGPGDKGKVMPRLIAQLKGRAEGQEINAIVTELLAKL